MLNGNLLVRDILRGNLFVKVEIRDDCSRQTIWLEASMSNKDYAVIAKHCLDCIEEINDVPCIIWGVRGVENMTVAAIWWDNLMSNRWDRHCVESVLIWSYSGPHFPAFGLNADQNNSEYRYFLLSEKVSDTHNEFALFVLAKVLEC